MEEIKLRYERAAENWMEALPLGNGSLGAMVYGGAERDRIALNEESFWAGYAKDTNQKQAEKYLPQVRKLVKEGAYQAAQDMIEKNMLSSFTQPYQPLCTMHLEIEPSGTITGYSRELHMNQGMMHVNYETEDGSWRREYFCSYPDQVMAVSIATSHKNSLHFTVSLDNVCPFRCFPIGADTMGIETEAPSEVCVGDVYHFHDNNQIHYDKSKETIKGYLAVKAVLEDGEICYTESGLHIQNSSQVFLYIAAATTFADKHALQTCEERVLRGAQKGYESLRAKHAADFAGLFDRMSLFINRDEHSQNIFHEYQVEELMNESNQSDFIQDNLNQKHRDKVTELLFQYGRYLTIAASREGCLPSNLQGIWNGSAVPPWWSNWTMNINLQMNYWSVYRCNLRECAKPYHDFIEKVAQKGKKTAAVHYGSKGWTSHHMMDLWMNTAPVGYDNKPVRDSASWASWNMSAPWLCLDLWESYHYTKDKEYLRDITFPIMEGCAEFLEDWLQWQDGRYQTAPSTSPESIFILDGNVRCAVCQTSAMDMELIGEFFKAFISAGKIVGIQQSKLARYSHIADNLAPIQIGAYGQILEWGREFEEEDQGHRHFSMLYSLYPGHGFTEKENPQLYRAAKVSLKRRLDNGGGSTGWSRVWAICLWARLKQGQEAYHSVLEFIKEDVFANLFGYHPPDFFQIDCNFGFTAAVAEMLVQEEDGRILPLPSIPKEWKQGLVTGLVTEGGNRLDICWQNHKPKKIVVYGAFNGSFYIESKENSIVLSQGEEIPYQRQGNIISFMQEKGKEYHIYYDYNNKDT